MKTTIIVNPISGGGKGGDFFACLKKVIEESGDTFEVKITECAGQAREYVSSLNGKMDGLIVIGGDGTFNEVLNGLADYSSCPVLVVPQGTANMLAKELKLPNHPKELYNLVKSVKTREIDVAEAYGEWGTRKFVLLSSIGFDASVTKEVLQSRRGTMGYGAYIRPIIKILKNYKMPELKVITEKNETHSSSMVVISNTKNYGGFLTLAREAEMRDGLLDIVIFKNKFIYTLLFQTLSAYIRRNARIPWVVYRKEREITVYAEKPVPVQADGDFLGFTPVKIKVLKAPLRVYAEEEGNT